jgi:hypothetical protein
MATKTTLNSAQQLASPNATWIEWEELHIKLSEKVIKAIIVWHSDSGVIPVNGQVQVHKIVRNIPDNPDTPLVDEKDNKFNKCWKYTIKADDAGKDLGQLLVKQIWQELKAELLTGDNDGTIEET